MLDDRRSLINFKGRCLRDIGAELRIQFIHIVSKDRGIVARAGNRDVAETGIEQVRVNAGIGIDQDALCGESLGTVASDRIAVIEMAMFIGVELYAPVVVETGSDLPIRRRRTR